VITVLQLLTGMALAGGTIYLTFELQILHHTAPAATGVRLLPEAGGLILGALIGGQTLKRGGPLSLVVPAGSAVSAAAFLVLAMVGAHASYPALAALLVAFGAGAGAGMGTEVILLQSTVERRDLGIATAGVRFIETLGTAVAGAGFAAVFAAQAGLRHPSLGSVSSALETVFLIAGALMGLAALAATRLPAATAAVSDVKADLTDGDVKTTLTA
jgi:MFS family permease